MARIRSVKPTFWTDEKIGLLPRAVRLTFLGLISAMADDHGRLSGVARIVRGAVYPFDEDVITTDVESHLAALADAGLITRYTVNGGQFIHIRNWLRHQKVDKPSPSLLPPPPAESSIIPRTVDDHSSNGARTLPTERSGAEGNGEDREESGAEGIREQSANDLDAVVRDEDRAAPPAPRVGALPIDAERFLEQCYSLGTEKRRLDVRRQLYDALDPQSRGARLRRGVHVKARSPEHLAECCRDVLADPPRNIDAAIVILLEKLLDPPKGPSPAEQRVERERIEQRHEEQYTAERRRAALRWAHEHADEYRQLRADVESRPEYATFSQSSVTKQAVEVEVTQRCAERAQFPPFDAWIAHHAAEFATA